MSVSVSCCCIEVSSSFNTLPLPKPPPKTTTTSIIIIFKILHWLSCGIKVTSNEKNYKFSQLVFFFLFFVASFLFLLFFG